MEHLDDEVCGLLAQIGFYRVNLGIESGSREVLDGVQKRMDLSRVPEKVALLRRHGIYIVGNFMLGFPGETRAQMELTLKLALALDFTAANFSIYTPMPGTRLYETLVAQGKIPRETEFKNYEFVSYENRLSELSPDELRSFRNYCLRRFLLRPRTVSTLYRLHRDGILWKNLGHRLYFMYVGKMLAKSLSKAPM
jgi:radical SAM superfamily enzyme YgiQ (UPF0313 family)